ncbi:helix-turn-helix domain-containing protein [Nocardia asteroides]|uniref:helix-turn-helix domain-containing protein n=1 Tax=Nocardia asteroides TaxID=1824 RepID=UPI001E3BB3D4|nr:hypothetical protein [Nocardia asteroides]UGT63137.1 hypothetical protein LTT61_07385 [Nocardia asteroides]
MIVTKWTGIEVRALRTAALRFTQLEFAETLGFTVGAVRKWEGRRETIELAGRFAAAMDTVLGRLTDSERTRFRAALSGSVNSVYGVASEPFEPLAVIAARTRDLAELDTDCEFLELLSLTLGDVIERYESVGPLRSAPVVMEARRQIEVMLGQRRHPAQLERLYAIAARLSGVLGYMAVNRGRFGHARLYCREAFALAGLHEDTDLQAWVKGTESLCAYYQRDFPAAVRAAYEGLDLAEGGAQSIRLYSNGLARALGKVGDREGVAAAIDAATVVAARFDTGSALTPALDFAPYGEARLMANAATAFLSAGDHARALDYGRRVEERVNGSDSVWSRSLVRIDMAAALASGKQRDVDRAVALGIEALAASHDRPIRSVWQRAHELGEIIGSIRARASGDYLDTLREWDTTAREFAASPS